MSFYFHPGFYAYRMPEYQDLLAAGEIEQRGATVEFAETLRGYIAFGETDPATGFREGQQADNTLQARLKVSIDDIDQFLRDPNHCAAITGVVECPELGGRLAVEAGTLSLFPDDDPHTPQEMRYTLSFRDGVGRPLTLVGTKRLCSTSVGGMWHDTTTVAIKVLSGDSSEAIDAPDQLVASGVLRITLWGVLLMLLQLRSGSAQGQRAFTAVPHFMGFFARKLLVNYFGFTRRGPALNRVRYALEATRAIR